MIVYKFGGALARTKRGMEALVRLTVEAYQKETARAKRKGHATQSNGLVLVVSAIGHTTRHLARAAELAEHGNLIEAEQVLDRTVNQHEVLAEQLGLTEATSERFYTITTQVRSLLEGIAIVRELSPRTRDAVIAAGEDFAAALIVALLEDRELPVRFVDARHIIITDENHGNAARLPDETTHSVRQRVLPRLNRHEIVLTQGFVGATRDGITTTMGTESSDLTATLLAGALAASEVVIWKSLPGLYTADPEIVPNAKLIRSLSFDEAEEMGRRGARILFPSFAHPLLASESKTILRVATPFGRMGRHTVLQHVLPPPARLSPQKALALATHQRLLLVHLRERTSGGARGSAEPNGMPRSRQRVESSTSNLLHNPILMWSTPMERIVLIHKEDRASFLREIEAAKAVEISAEHSVAAISLVIRKPTTNPADSRFAAGIARSLRGFHTHAILPFEQSLLAIVDEGEAVAAMRKLHHDLFEV